MESSDDEEKEEKEESENADDDDQDLFGERFQNSKFNSIVPAPKENEVEAPTAEAASGGGNFHKNLQGMLQNAAVLGALSQANGW